MLKSISDDDSTPADFKPPKYGHPDLNRALRKGSSVSAGAVLLGLSPLVLLSALVLKVWSHRRSMR